MLEYPSRVTKNVIDRANIFTFTHEKNRPSAEKKLPTNMQTLRNDNFTQMFGRELNFMARRQPFSIDCVESKWNDFLALLAAWIQR